MIMQISEGARKRQSPKLPSIQSTSGNHSLHEGLNQPRGLKPPQVPISRQLGRALLVPKKCCIACKSGVLRRCRRKSITFRRKFHSCHAPPLALCVLSVDTTGPAKNSPQVRAAVVEVSYHCMRSYTSNRIDAVDSQQSQGPNQKMHTCDGSSLELSREPCAMQLVHCETFAPLGRVLRCKWPRHITAVAECRV